jgi:hypothetical protein
MDTEHQGAEYEAFEQIHSVDVLKVIRESAGHACVAERIGMFCACPTGDFGRRFNADVVSHGGKASPDTNWMIGEIMFSQMFLLLPEFAQSLLGGLTQFEQRCLELCLQNKCSVIFLDCVPCGGAIVQRIGTVGVVAVEIDQAGQN